MVWACEEKRGKLCEEMYGQIARSFHSINCLFTFFIYLAAVRRNAHLGKVMKSEVETVVKLWLSYLGDRSGGRAARVKASRSHPESVYSD